MESNNTPMEPNNTATEQSTINPAKMTVCKSCGAQIAKNAKVCPSCGAKNKKPIYKRWYFYAIIVIVLIIILASANGKDSGSSSENTNAEIDAKTSSVAATKQTTIAKQIEYSTVTIEQLLSDLKSNAYNAKQTWNGAYVTVTGGKVLTIDASGAYFSIESDLDEYILQSIHISIPASIRDDVMRRVSTGASVTVHGKITEVGEIIGYTIDAAEVDF